MDFARQMIRLAGLRPDKDVEIVLTGPRPGEKLREELFHEAEPMVETGRPGMHLASPRTVNRELLGRSFDELADLCTSERRDEAMHLLQRLVPEYPYGEQKGRALR